MKMMPPDVISHENQLQHLSQPSIFILDVFRTADHAGQIFIRHRHISEDTVPDDRGDPIMDELLNWVLVKTRYMQSVNMAKPRHPTNLVSTTNRTRLKGCNQLEGVHSKKKSNSLID